MKESTFGLITAGATAGLLALNAAIYKDITEGREKTCMALQQGQDPGELPHYMNGRHIDEEIKDCKSSYQIDITRSCAAAAILKSTQMAISRPADLFQEAKKETGECK